MPPDALDAEALRQLHALSSLSERGRRIFTLRKIYGWEYDRIAQQLGVELTVVERDLTEAALLCVGAEDARILQ
jgi:DNA-directed RNA polymerase specialized sigma24 family protein